MDHDHSADTPAAPEAPQASESPHAPEAAPAPAAPAAPEADFDGLAGKPAAALTPEELRLMADTMPGDGPGD